MSPIKQVLFEVNRGMTDKTPVLVYPWEVPLLEDIHGEGNVTEVTHAETLKLIKRTKVDEPHRTRIELAEGQVRESPYYDPLDDIAAEYGRMQAKYGMHPSIEMTIVEHVYGRLASGQFEAAVLECVPEEDRDGREVTIVTASSVETLSGAEVRAELDKRHVKFKRTSSLSALKQQLEEVLQNEFERAQSGEGKKKKAA